ncbi:MAG: hypothetical protein V3S27_09415, partial [Kiloniellales bacterium]
AGRFLPPAAPARELAVSGTAAQRAPDWRQKSPQSPLAVKWVNIKGGRYDPSDSQFVNALC